MVAKSNIKK
jgi:hypothetical protein